MKKIALITFLLIQSSVLLYAQISNDKIIKRILLLAIGLLAIVSTSCKKIPTADFDYNLENHYAWVDGEYKTDYVTVHTTNYSGNADEYWWTFKKLPYGPERLSNEKNPSFTCNESGDYTLSLEVYSKSKDKDKRTVQFSISVGDSVNPDIPVDPSLPPTASFSINSSNGAYTPSVISCTNTSTNATHYQWTLTRPDTTIITSTDNNPSFLCQLWGIYTLQLIAYNANDQSSVYTMDFTLNAPSYFTITWLRLESIPMIDSNNASWDTTYTDADPDIFFTITESNGTTILYQSEVKNNTAAEDFPVTWTPVNQTLSYYTDYIVKFWDQDDLTLDGNDLMASCLLSSAQMNQGDTFTWSNTNIGVRFVIGLHWSN